MIIKGIYNVKGRGKVLEIMPENDDRVLPKIGDKLYVKGKMIGEIRTLEFVTNAKMFGAVLKNPDVEGIMSEDRVYLKSDMRDRLEEWCDRHNHKMELLRTIVPIIVLILQIFIFIKIF